MQNQLHNHFVNVNHAVVSVRRSAACSPICTEQRCMASRGLPAALHHFLSPSPSWVNDSEADPFLTIVSRILFCCFQWEMDQALTFVSTSHPHCRSNNTGISSLVLSKLQLTEKVSHQRKSNNFAKFQLASIKWDSHHLSLVKKIRSKLVI